MLTYLLSDMTLLYKILTFFYTSCKQGKGFTNPGGGFTSLVTIIKRLEIKLANDSIFADTNLHKY